MGGILGVTIFVIVFLLMIVGIELGLGRLIFGPMPHKAFCTCEACQRKDAETEASHREWKRLKRLREDGA